jgi:hypothetical protein
MDAVHRKEEKKTRYHTYTHTITKSYLISQKRWLKKKRRGKRKNFSRGFPPEGMRKLKPTNTDIEETTHALSLSSSGKEKTFIIMSHARDPRWQNLAAARIRGNVRADQSGAHNGGECKGISILRA